MVTHPPVPAEHIYPIEEICAALRHARQGERRGKIVVAPNGPVASTQGERR
jgi:NADPH:quinone reductase-like Zn-dependent oxidoreductase